MKRPGVSKNPENKTVAKAVGTAAKAVGKYVYSISGIPALTKGKAKPAKNKTKAWHR